MASRFDFFTVNAPKKDANEFLTVDSTPTRAGIFTYYEADGLGGIKEVKELRHPNEVFSKETMDSLNGKPYTTQENHVSLFTPRDASRKTYGFTLGDAERVDNHARVSITVIDQKEIEAIEGKKGLELSAGYRCDTFGPSEFIYGGTWEGERYDREQRNIQYNHVARVVKARGGESCRIRLDSDSAICGIQADRIDSDDISEHNGESIMTLVKGKISAVKTKDFRLDAETVEIPAEHEGVIDRLEKRQELMVEAIEKRDEKLDSLTNENTRLQAKVDVLEKDNKDLKESNEKMIPAEKLDSHVRERAKYLNYAEQYKIEGAENLPNEDILKEIVKKSDKVKDEAKLDNMVYVEAVFDTIDHEYEKKKIASKENLEKHRIDNDGKVSSFDAAKKKRNA